MFLKRYFRLRHFIKLIRFFLSDSFLFSNKPVVKTKTLLLVKTEAIGDYILFRNFIQVIKESEKFHDYQITLIGNELWKDLAISEDAIYCEQFIWINRKKLTDDVQYRNQILKEVHQLGFEYVVQANFSREFLIGDSIVRASQAPFKIGSLGDAANDLSVFKSISDTWYTHLYNNNSIPVFEFTKNKVFFEELLQNEISFEIPFFHQNNSGLNRNGIILFPGAGEIIKQWPTNKFAQLIKEIRKSYNGKISICGSTSDSILADEIISISADNLIENVCGKTSLIELNKLLASCDLLITNDSGAFHIAAANQTPCICLLMGRHYGRFAPYPKQANWIELVFPSSFYPYLKNIEEAVEITRYSSPSTIEEITVDEVFQAYLKINSRSY